MAIYGDNRSLLDYLRQISRTETLRERIAAGHCLSYSLFVVPNPSSPYRNLIVNWDDGSNSTYCITDNHIAILMEQSFTPSLADDVVSQTIERNFGESVVENYRRDVDWAYGSSENLLRSITMPSIPLNPGPGNWAEVRSAFCPLLLSVDQKVIYGPYSNHLFSILSPFMSTLPSPDGVYRLKSVNDRLLEVLRQWGTRRVYCYHDLRFYSDHPALDGLDTYGQSRLPQCYHLSHTLHGERLIFTNDWLSDAYPISTINVCLATTSSEISEGPFRTFGSSWHLDYVAGLKSAIEDLLIRRFSRFTPTWTPSIVPEIPPTSAPIADPPCLNPLGTVGRIR